MKHLFILAALFFSYDLAAGQKITLGDLSKYTFCPGEIVKVPFFYDGLICDSADFFLQISDTNGSNYKIISKSFGIAPDTMQGLLPVTHGSHYHLRVILGCPTIISDTSKEIQILSIPNPKPVANIRTTRYGYTALVNDSIPLADTTAEEMNSSYFWAFDQDANLNWTTSPSPTIVYGSLGMKKNLLTVTNSEGCKSTQQVSTYIVGCRPQIPASAHIVTSIEKGGSSKIIWIQNGGDYTDDTARTIFVESGGTLRLGQYGSGTYYLKAGSILDIGSSRKWRALALVDKNLILTLDNSSLVDTFYCNDLQFDYTKVGVTYFPDENRLQILPSGNTISIKHDNSEISATVFSPLGVKLFSKTDRNTLNLDLSTLAEGMYFVEVSSGKRHEVRKIVVMH